MFSKNTLKFLLFTLALQFAVPVISRASEDDLYKFLWLDPDKSVYVLQNKLHPKSKTFYADIGYLMSLSGEFQNSKGFNFEFGYFFNENWAIELAGNLYNNSNNNAYNNLQSLKKGVPFIRRLNNTYSLFAIYSPFYGKINTFNKIFYFDWSFGVGLTKIGAESNATTVSDLNASTTFSSESYVGGSIKSQFKFYINKKIHLNIEYLRTTYRAPGPVIEDIKGQDKWRANSDLIFGIGFSF